MRYNPLPASFYIRNRKNVMGEMAEHSVAILVSHDEYPRCGDTTHAFRQNSELLYLCGIDQEESFLTLAPWHPNPAYREILFIKNPSPEKIVWFGHRLSKEEASQLSGIQTVMYVEAFEGILNDLMMHAKHVYLHIPEDPRIKPSFPTHEVRFAQQLKQDYPLHDFCRLAPILYLLRNVKSPEELSTMKKACDITRIAFESAAKDLRPGKYEY